MSRIGATISGFEQMLLNQLAAHDSASFGNALRISTGEKINSAADSPSGIIRLTQLQRDLKVVNSTATAVDLATSVGAQTQQNLDLVRTQLNTIRTSLLKDEAQSLTANERLTEQAVIDVAIEELDRIVGLEIEGHRILQGANDFSVSGADTAEVNDVMIYSANGSTITATVADAATQGTLTYTGVATTTDGDATITIEGAGGSLALSIVDGEALDDVAERINSYSHDTGVTADVNGSDLVLTTVGYGSDATVSVTVESGSFDVTGTGVGGDIDVRINDTTMTANDINGNTVSYNRNGMKFDIEFVAGFEGTISPITVGDGNAMRFRLTPNVSDVTEFAIKDVSSAKLGGDSGFLLQLKTGGDLSGLDSNTSAAIRVVDEALEMLTIQEGRADAFADVSVASAAAVMDAMQTSISDAISAMNDVDEDAESLLLQKNQTLATNTLSALSILQQQQSSIVQIVKQIAGLA